MQTTRLTALSPWYSRAPLAVALLATVSPLLPALHAQQSAPAPAASGDQNGTATLDPAALADLLGPIALYPDALVALILPAATVPTDVTLAARYLANGGDPNNVGDQSWDDSVKALARYPDVVKWMDDNLEWTTSVGDTFIAQPADVMTAIQSLRAQAQTAGNLVDTPQQKVVKEVVKETTYIQIVPAEPDVIYVPDYDPEVVYVERQPDYIGPIIGFGAGFAIGSWLNYDCNWGDRGIYRGDYRPGWNRGWNDDRGGNNVVNTNIVNNNVNVTNITNNSAQRWQPSANSRRQLYQNRNNYNRRVQAANAEVRHANPNHVIAGKPAAPRHVQSLPRPSRLANSPNYPNRNKAGSVNAQRPNAPGNYPGNGKPHNAPAVAHRDGKQNNNQGGQGARKQNSGVNAPTTQAPNVPGQLGKPHKLGNGGNGNNHSKYPNANGKQPGGANGPSSKPASANGPQKPRKQPDSAPKVSHPSSAPGGSVNHSNKQGQTSRPKPAEPSEAPRATRPPQGGNGGQSANRPKPQSPSTSPSRKQPSSNGGGGNGGRPKQNASTSSHPNNPASGGGNKQGNNGGGDKKKKSDKKDHQN